MTAPLPSGAATQTTLAALLTELQAKAGLTETQPVSVASLPVTQVTAEGGDVLFNLESAVSGFATDANADAGYNNVHGDAVPAGKIWVLTCVSAWNDTSASTRISIGVYDGSATAWAKSLEGPAADQVLTLETHLVLGAGSFVEGHYYGCTAGDDIGIAWWGYQMDAP